MQVVAHLVLNVPVVDCVLLPDEQPVLGVLLAKEKSTSVGNHFVLYTLELDGLHFDAESKLDYNYTQLVVNTNNKNICYGSVHCSRNIHVLEVKRKVKKSWYRVKNKSREPLVINSFFFFPFLLGGSPLKEC